MKARIDYFCRPVSPVANYALENIHIHVDLPFVPAVGTMLKVTKDMDYIEIDDVLLDLAPDGEGLVIGLLCPDNLDNLWPHDVMQKLGWKLS